MCFTLCEQSCFIAGLFDILVSLCFLFMEFWKNVELFPHLPSCFEKNEQFYLFYLLTWLFPYNCCITHLWASSLVFYFIEMVGTLLPFCSLICHLHRTPLDHMYLGMGKSMRIPLPALFSKMANGTLIIECHRCWLHILIAYFFIWILALIKFSKEHQCIYFTHVLCMWMSATHCIFSNCYHCRNFLN